ncbi:sulfite exporter TauE/SafE family protein [Enterocloster citroniae]|uniref:sulfite exporter TauE/SafE family protein n=1 Tax=Enterocloster citroniae TaxID=358743 RepID=UPI001FABA175|nr:sulfite exporter TauE/SafE family protein [Enterocloster citroniae]
MMVWWAVAAVAAFFIKGLCGFANTLVFTSILSFSNNNSVISPVELLLGYPTNMILAWKERRSIKWSICIPLSILVVMGSIPGILFLKNADVRMIKIFFGFIIILIGMEMLYREYHTKPVKQSKILLGLIGILSGLLCGLYGIGALLGAYVNRVTDDTHSFKANICIVFLIENTLRILLYGLWGMVSLELVKTSIMLIPFMLLGLSLGIFSGRILPEKAVRKLVVVMLIISGAALVMKSI